MTITPSQRRLDEDVDAIAPNDRRVIGGRYHVLRELKSGPDTQVFLASDLTVGTTVVIKTAAAAQT